MITLFLFTLLLCKICGAPSEFIEDNGLIVKEVLFGETVLLQCRSNVNNYIFDYWLFDNRKIVIGPSNSYDQFKYRFEILSGNLTIRAVTKNDEGRYGCISKAIHGENINVEFADLLILQNWEQVYEHSSSLNLIRILIASIIIVLIGGGVYISYNLWRDRYRFPRYLEQSEDEDEDSGEEIFSAPGTSTGKLIGKQSGEHSFDNITTDFKSILDTASEK